MYGVGFYVKICFQQHWLFISLNDPKLHWFNLPLSALCFQDYLCEAAKSINLPEKINGEDGDGEQKNNNVEEES